MTYVTDLKTNIYSDTLQCSNNAEKISPFADKKSFILIFFLPLQSALYRPKIFKIVHDSKVS